VPDIFAGLGPQRHDRGEIEIVPLSRRAVELVPGRTIAHADIKQVKLRIIGHGIPHGATAALLPPFALPGGLGRLEVRFGVLARRIGHRIEPPQLLAGIGVICGQEAAHAHFRAAVADQHHAVDHARRAGDGIGL
jgi:hypothetical protein